MLTGRKNKWILSALLCLSIGVVHAEESSDSVPAEVPGNEAAAPVAVPEAPVPEISEQQFQLERQAMIDDLTEKLKILGTTRECAVSTQNQADLRQCADAFREAILKKRTAP
ncbi:MAG: hypothetical protein LBR88_04760 [Zoogloeaceae bacterium]|jgi:hypothetical protein|nr:hypothetical protein [Zoogloeaceae bacterium]